MAQELHAPAVEGRRSLKTIVTDEAGAAAAKEACPETLEVLRPRGPCLFVFNVGSARATSAGISVLAERIRPMIDLGAALVVLEEGARLDMIPEGVMRENGWVRA